MPASAFSRQISDAIYLLSMFALLLFLSKPVYVLYLGAEQRSAEMVATGVAEAIDSLSPGTTISLKLEGRPGTLMAVRLSGTTVSASIGGSSATAALRWSAPEKSLAPGVTYSLSIGGDELVVAEKGAG